MAQFPASTACWCSLILFPKHLPLLAYIGYRAIGIWDLVHHTCLFVHGDPVLCLHQCKLQRVMTTMNASGVFVLVDGRKTPPAQVAQCQDHLGHKYRNKMQQPNAGSTRARSELSPLCKLHLVAASSSYTCAQDGLDTATLTCAAGVFLWRTSTFTNVYTNK